MRALLPLLLLTACSTTDTTPGIEVRTVEVLKEVQRPCPVTPPLRPAPLDRPLPADSAALAALLGAKLAQWAGPGGYGDRAAAAIEICTRATP